MVAPAALSPYAVRLLKIVVVPPSHVLSEGGDKGVVDRRMRKHPSDLRFERGSGVEVALECARGV